MIDPSSGDSVNIASFGLVNSSSHVTAADAQAIAASCEVQLGRDVAPIWNLPALTIAVFDSLEAVPVDAGIFVMRLVDQADQPDSLGYHNAFYGEVEVPPILAQGCGILRNQALYAADTVSSVASHEFIEAAVDPDVDLWVPTGQDSAQQAFEACDPVQGSFYEVNGVQVSDFVYPQAFVTGLPTGTQYDYLHELSGPFQIAPGGYAVRESAAGETTDVFGTKAPQPWRLLLSARRKARHSNDRPRRRSPGPRKGAA